MNNIENGNGHPIDPVIFNDWHVVAASHVIQPGSLTKAQLLDTDLVVWRDLDGTVHVWRDRCPHRSVRLSGGKVVENTVVCPYHGLTYDSQGKCVKVPPHPDYTPPPQACIETFAVQERYGLVYACLGTTPSSLPVPSEVDDTNFRSVIAGPYAINTNGLRAIENFLDIAHLPFLHTGILGNPNNPEILDYVVEVEPDGVHANNVRVWQPDPYGTGQGGTYIDYDYRVIRPFTAYLRKADTSGQFKVILFHVTPISEVNAIGWMLLSLNLAKDSTPEAIRSHQDRIFMQDTHILESHKPELIPLDAPTTEFHLPSDLTSLAYRKWLKHLGLTYGILR